jgi:hypothetical protein
MQLTFLRSLRSKTALLGIALMVFSMALLHSCGENDGSQDPAALPADEHSFTFFDLSKHTKLTESVRSELTDKLGNDAIQRRNIIDLKINYQEFLKEFFPELDEINRQLNFPPRERVEHNTVKLMYRYARKKNVPFDLVELIFSGYNLRPLLIRIQFKSDEANSVEALKEKYGEPGLIQWQKEGGRSIFWKQDGDTLILNYIPNQFEGFDHQIVIYYTENLKQLVDIEKKEKEAREQQRAKKVDRAF